MNYQNVAIQSLRQAYPEAILHKQTPNSTDWRVAFTLPISPGVPLYMKISLLQGFPYTAPVISCMARVTHPNIERNTYAYKGPVIQNWNQNSNLTATVKAIHEEFKVNPPMPEGAHQHAGGQVHNQQHQAAQFENKQERYKGETVVLQKPFMTDIKKRIMAMDNMEV